MVEKPDANEPSLNGSDSSPEAALPRRPAGHRAPDMRDTMAELTERAQLISQEAGSKVAMAMKDVIAAAAGLAGFAIESARDLVQYMVRRGQMSQEEADRLIRDAEDAHAKRPASERGRPSASKAAADRAAAAKAESIARAAALSAPHQVPATAQAHAPSAHGPSNAPAPASGHVAGQRAKAQAGPPPKSFAAKRAAPASSAAASAIKPKKAAARVGKPVKSAKSAAKTAATKPKKKKR